MTLTITKRLNFGLHAAMVAMVMLLSQTIQSQTLSLSQLSFTEVVPADLLASRSVVLYDPAFTLQELQEIQKTFQQIGIDAVVYFETDKVVAGKDLTKAYVEYFTSRQIRYLLFFEKSAEGFQLTGPLFNQKNNLFDALPTWHLKNSRLSELLRTAFQDSWRSQKKQNFLVNEFPETDIVVDPIKGKRQDFYALDLKVDELAVPKFGNEAMDKELEQLFKTHYPWKYKITEAGVDESELRRQGFAYVLCFVYTRGKAAREILDYDMTKAENAFASITFPSGQLQLKTIPANKEVYKFYFRHINSGNVFLGTKWDADVTWQDALRNHILGFKNELRIN